MTGVVSSPGTGEIAEACVRQAIGQEPRGSSIEAFRRRSRLIRPVYRAPLGRRITFHFNTGLRLATHPCALLSSPAGASSPMFRAWRQSCSQQPPLTARCSCSRQRAKKLGETHIHRSAESVSPNSSQVMEGCRLQTAGHRKTSWSSTLNRMTFLKPAASPQAGWRSPSASLSRARAVWSRRLIVPTGLENRSLISLSD
jgi:hypothetical protein